MKRIFLKSTFMVGLLALSQIVSAAGEHCKQIEQDLLSLNYLQQKSTLPSCKDTLSPLCCDASVDPNSCKSLGELQEEYNTAMSKLVLGQGMASLGMAIEGHHNSLKFISPKKLVKAKNHINKFKSALKRANLLVQSLKFNGDDNFWNDYLDQGISNPLELANYMRQSCVKTSSKAESYKSFCSQINDISVKKDLSEYEQLAQTMHGFLTADSKGHISPTLDRANRRKRFQQEYPKYFNITVKGSDDKSVVYPITEYNKSNPHYQKIDEIEGLIKEIEFTRSGVKRDQKSKIALEKLSKKLKNLREIEVSFDHSATNNPGIESEFTKSFSKPVTELHLSNIMVAEGISDNFVAQNKELKNDIAPKKLSMFNEMKKYLEVDAQVECSDLNSFKKAYQCMRDYCKPNSANGCDDATYDRIGMGEKFAQMDQLNRYEEVQQTFQSITDDCIENEKLDLTEKQSCIEDKKNNIEHLDLANISNLDKLEKDVKEKEELLKRIQEARKFKEMQTQKNIAIYALDQTNCLSTDNVERVQASQVSCNTQLNHQTNSEYLKLETLGSQIKIKVEKDLIKDFLQYDDTYLEKGYAQVQNDCYKEDQTTEQLKGLCTYFRDEKIRKQKLKEHNQRARAAKRKKDKPEYVVVFGAQPQVEEAGFGTFMSAFGKALVPTLPLVAQLKMQEQSERDWSKSQVRKYETLTQINQYQREQYKMFLKNQNNSTISNIGLPQNSYTFANVSNFQANSQNTFISANDPYAFSFTPIPTTVTPLTTDPASPSTTTSFSL